MESINIIYNQLTVCTIQTMQSSWQTHKTVATVIAKESSKSEAFEA